MKHKEELAEWVPLVANKEEIMAKVNFLKITSPKGEALYPYLKNPEVYDGEVVGLTIQVKFSQKDTNTLIGKLEEELERVKSDPKFQGRKWAKEPHLGYRENKDGDIIFKFKTKAEFTNKDGDVVKRTVPTFDSKGKPIDVSLGNGSIVRVAFQVVPFWKSLKQNGLSLFLDAVQVIELKEYTGGTDAGAYGFGEEQGFTAEATDADRFDNLDLENEDVDPDEEF